jgi:hypothetical protein
MGAGLLAVKSGFILFIKRYQFPLQINTLEREREKSGFILFIKNYQFPLQINTLERERERERGSCICYHCVLN